MDSLRRLYNAVDAVFDRSSLTERVQLSREVGPGSGPITAAQALSLCRPMARDFDRKARLVLIVAPDGTLQEDGTARRWELFWDLPRRRAHLRSEWHLPWSEEADSFLAGRVDVTVDPFPPPDSLLHRQVREGKLLRRQLDGLWRQELRRKPPLPLDFRDSDEALRQLVQKGLDLTRSEVTLKAEHPPGKHPRWSAETRDTVLHVDFA